MTARIIYTHAFPDLQFELSGVGYDPKGGSLLMQPHPKMAHQYDSRDMYGRSTAATIEKKAAYLKSNIEKRPHI